VHNLAMKMMAMCLLAVSLTAFAQSSGEMKQDDNMMQDQKKDDVKKAKKATKTKEEQAKKTA